MARRRVYLFLGLILLLVAVCIVVSFKNEFAGLNRVSLSATAPNQIRVNVDVSGVFRFTDIEKLALPADCRVEEVNVSVGENFEEGQPLLRLNPDDAAILYYQALLQQRALEEQRDQGDEIRRELTGHSLSKLAEQTAFLAELWQNEGVVYAEVPGQVTELNVVPGDITTGRSALSYGNLEGEGYFEWTVDAKQYRPFTEITGQGEGFSLELKTASRLYLEEKRIYRYASKPVPVESVQNPVHGMHAEIQMRYFSDEYPAVLPKSSIVTEGDGSTYVFVVKERDSFLGVESYVQKVGVTVEEQDGTNAAVLAPLEGLVVHSTRPLTDLEKVLMIDEEL